MGMAIRTSMRFEFPKTKWMGNDSKLEEGRDGKTVPFDFYESFPSSQALDFYAVTKAHDGSGDALFFVDGLARLCDRGSGIEKSEPKSSASADDQCSFPPPGP